MAQLAVFDELAILPESSGARLTISSSATIDPFICRIANLDRGVFDGLERLAIARHALPVYGDLASTWSDARRANLYTRNPLASLELAS
jgi:hypothetical protein